MSRGSTSCHQQADPLTSRIVRRQHRDDSAIGHHCDAVGKTEYLIELGRDKQYGRAAVTCIPHRGARAAPDIRTS